MSYKPIIGITMGDPAGVGPEITLKAFNNKEIYKRCRPVVIGDAAIIKMALNYVKAPALRINIICDIKDAEFRHGTIDVYHLDLLRGKSLEIGTVSEIAGTAAYQCVEKVIELAMNKEIDATVTNAINKEAINLAGYHYSGHTEIYADLTHTSRYTMMLAFEQIRVVHVSTHVSLREACDFVKKDRIIEVIEIAYDACKKMNISNPRIGVAALNPHSGENGLFGREEIEEIIPAIEEVKKKGICAEGPVPADSIFSKARGGWYDIVVAMYHDQGHIPLKVLGFHYNETEKKWNAVDGVNVTLGLPIIRTSVDHGTAFDQAGKGTASEVSLVSAINYGIEFACSKNR